MTNSVEHLDHALEEEFAGHGETIHKLKAANPHFKALMQQTHDLWSQIQSIQNGLTPADDHVRHDLEKQRLKLLDEIAALVRGAES